MLEGTGCIYGHLTHALWKDTMKFIGIPKTVKKTGETIRSIIGAVLLVALVAVCVVGGAETLFTRSSTVTDSSDSAVDVAAPTPASTEMAPLDMNATTPSLAGRSADLTAYTEAPTAAPTAVPTAVPTPSVTETAESVHYYVTDALSIRTGPGTEYDKVGALSAGDEIDSAASTSNGWIKIADSQYVISDYLSTTPGEEALTGTYYAAGTLNVRTGPGTQYPSPKTLEAGSGIDVVAVTSNGWYKTVVGSYVKASLCTSTPPATPTPAPTPTPTPTPTPAPGSKQYLGEFTITFYGPTGHTTKTGTECTQGRTVAVDPGVIKLLSKIYIEGDPLGDDGYYIAEDTGSAVTGNIIDIYAEDGESRGTLYGVKVYIVTPG